MWRGLTFLLPFLFFGQVSAHRSLRGPARGQSLRWEQIMPYSRLRSATWMSHRSPQAAAAMRYGCQGQGNAFDKC